MMNTRLAIPALTVVILLASCKKETVEPDFSDDYKAGGATTIHSAGPDAYTFPLANIDGAGLARHTEADALFEQQFVTAPAIRFGGLGPLFNQNACQSCHIRNGRSQPPVSPSDQASGLLIRLSVPGAGEHGGPAPVPGFGGQFQPKAIFGGVPEGKLAWTEMQQIVQFLGYVTGNGLIHAVRHCVNLPAYATLTLYSTDARCGLHVTDIILPHRLEA